MPLSRTTEARLVTALVLTAAAASMPGRILSNCISSPMTPVDMTRAWVASTPITAAALAAIASASRSPCSPVQALAFPELMIPPRAVARGTRLTDVWLDARKIRQMHVDPRELFPAKVLRDRHRRKRNPVGARRG